MGITDAMSGTATDHLGLILPIILHVSTTAYVEIPTAQRDHL